MIQPLGATLSKFAESEILRDGLRQNEALRLCGPRGPERCRGERVARALQVDRLAVDLDLAVGQVVGAGDGPDQFGAPGADEAGNAEDLAGFDGERDVPERPVGDW